MTEPAPTIMLEWPRWLKLRQAAAYSAIGEKRLIDLAASDLIVGYKDPNSKRNDWIFDRISIDRYREAQATSCGAVNTRQKALDIIRSLKQCLP